MLKLRPRQLKLTQKNHLFQASLNLHVPLLLFGFQFIAFLQERRSLHISLQDFLYSGSLVCNHLLLAVEDVYARGDRERPRGDVAEKGRLAMTGTKQCNDMAIPRYYLGSWLKICADNEPHALHNAIVRDTRKFLTAYFPFTSRGLILVFTELL
jgi:hypothetical protein